MNLNYHYFAVKAIASKSGFAEDEAQIIASYSQFVDDFDLHEPIPLDDVPEFARYLATKIPFGYFFNPVTTGFDGFSQALLLLEKNQKWVLTPFHFIPHKNIKQLPNRRDWRVIPARMDTPSLIREMLLNAKNIFIKDRKLNRKVNLMRIGMLLHTFADTYAHQNFSGYWGWENHSRLDKVIDNITGKDITGSYFPEVVHKLPSIGHLNVSTAPDDSNVTFSMHQRSSEKDDYTAYYSRSNTKEFLTPSREIMNFLRSCLEQPPIEESVWNEFSKSLTKGFLTAERKGTPLEKHWKGIFPAMRFYYSKEEMLKAMLTLCDELFDGGVLEILYGKEAFPIFSTRSDAFFHYNVLADKTRTTVHGENFMDMDWDTLQDEIKAKSQDGIEASGQ
jgi:hypothetical protein